jgi:phage tail-like protein
MATGSRSDPYLGFNFKVEIDNITVGAFKDCSGLDLSTKAVTYRDGTDPTNLQRQLPGLASVGGIKLSRGLASGKELWSWNEKVSKGNIERKPISIVLYDPTNKVEKVRWNFRECWPTKWTGPSFDASSDSVAIESLELVHEGIEAKSWT